MTEAGSARARRDLAALLRFLGRAAAPVVSGVEADRVSITDAGGSIRTFSDTALRQAASLGLIVRDGQSLSMTAAARAFLRRLQCAPDSAFQDQHRDLEHGMMADEDGRRRHVLRNHAESPLGSIARLKDRSGAAFLSSNAVEAGERLHADFTRAQLQPRMTMRYEPQLSTRTRGQTGEAGDLSDSALSARARVASAMEAIGPELSGVALDVCCFQKGLEVVERERQWPARSAKLMLRAALMTLARHYAPPQSRAGRERHAWGDQRFRPQTLADREP